MVNEKSDKNPKTVKLQLIASPIRRERKQRVHLKSLNLGKINSVSELIDTPAIQGLIKKVKHMIKVI